MLRSINRRLPVATAFIAAGTSVLMGNTYSQTRADNSYLNRNNTLTQMKDKVVMITGASAGIGKSCAWAFTMEGAKVILVGRRKALLDELKKDLQTSIPGARCHVLAMSVTDIDAVMKLPETLPEEFKNVDILVNNAGLALGTNPVHENSIQDTKTLLETNVLSVVALCKAFIPGMIKRGYGHIINMGSIAGQQPYPNGSIYNASKFAITGFSGAARHDLLATPIRVTHIMPGLVSNTEFSNVRFKDAEGGVSEAAAAELAAKVYRDLVVLHPDDVADTCVYAATRPPHMQIADLLVYGTNQSGVRDVARVGPSLGAPKK